MSKVKNYVDIILLSLSGVLIAVMSVLSIWQVSARFIFNTPSTFTEEVIRMLLIWFALMSAAYVFGQQKHIAIVFIRERFSIKGQLALVQMSNILLLVVAVVLMIWGGYHVVNLTMTQSAPSTDIPMAVMYSALPVSGLFIIFYTIYNIRTKHIPTADEGSEQV
ncbi:TRAP transporter small permease [Corticicoccus populi]|uniref:TRAP transporter small permease n=1 Tax=Corticicoccus populi TaxID=1812821 RepID=A0ABW5WX70_9STAP